MEPASKISKLIERLQTIKNQYGDLDIVEPQEGVTECMIQGTPIYYYPYHVDILPKVESLANDGDGTYFQVMRGREDKPVLVLR